VAKLQTEFEFYLPKGFVDDDGAVHRTGIMRLATARDELEPLRDPRVRDADDPFLTIIVLSRVVTELGTLSNVTPREIERLFAADLAYLQDVYGAVNFGSAADGAEVVAEASRRKREEAEEARNAGRRRLATPEPVEEFEDDLDDELDEDDEDEDDDTIDADTLAAALQARFGDDDELEAELKELSAGTSRRRHVEEIGTRRK
jgi:hypothetical protein